MGNVSADSNVSDRTANRMESVKDDFKSEVFGKGPLRIAEHAKPESSDLAADKDVPTACVAAGMGASTGKGNAGTSDKGTDTGAATVVSSDRDSMANHMESGKDDFKSRDFGEETLRFAMHVEHEGPNQGNAKEVPTASVAAGIGTSTAKGSPNTGTICVKGTDMGTATVDSNESDSMASRRESVKDDFKGRNIGRHAAHEEFKGSNMAIVTLAMLRRSFERRHGLLGGTLGAQRVQIKVMAQEWASSNMPTRNCDKAGAP